MSVVIVLTTLNIIGLGVNWLILRANVYMTDRTSKREELLKEVMQQIHNVETKQHRGVFTESAN